MPQVPPRSDFAGLLIIILFLYIFSSNEANLPPNFDSPRNYAEAQLNRSRSAVGVLNATAWGDFTPAEAGEQGRWLNLTGFREGDGYRWERLGVFRETCDKMRKWAEYREAAEIFQNGGTGLHGVYENVTGVVRGKWARYMGGLDGGKESRSRLNLSTIAPGIDWAVRDTDMEGWARNVTGRRGKMSLRLDEVEGEEMLYNRSSRHTPEPKAEDGIEDIDYGLVHPVKGILVRELSASLTVRDESSNGDGYEMRLHGIHWPQEGSILLTTTSDKFAGAYGLPHFAIDEEHFNSSAIVMKEILRKRLEKMEEAAKEDPRSLLEANHIDGLPTPHCEYVVFAQLQTLMLEGASAPLSQDIIKEIENELRFPNGAPVVEIPRLQMSVVILSPDCGFMLESIGPPNFATAEGEHLVGMKEEVFLQHVRNFLLMLAVVWFAQTLTIKLQCKEASTPSTVGRVSIHTMGMMLLADGLLFFAMSLASATMPSIFPCALLASFSGLMSLVLGVRFILNIHSVQEPERQEQERAQAAAAAAAQARNPAPSRPAATVITAAGADTLPLPATSNAQTNTANTPIIIPSDQDIDAEIAENTANAASAVPRPTTTQPSQASRAVTDFGPIYGQFVLLLTIILLVSLSSTSWPVFLRTAYTHLLSFIYLSLWLPQIKRNIRRNCRKALLWRFVIGQSVLRLLPFAYFYLYEDNILFSDGDGLAFAVLAGWVWCQILVLASQEILGPRWAAPKGWYEVGWDYHPVLREDGVEEGGLPIGLVKGTGGESLSRSNTGDEERMPGSHTRSVDCAICMQILEVSIVPAAGGADDGMVGVTGVTGVLARRAYMVTPCRHIFHTQCLEGWMKFRLQCPICRETLPPL
ncbi:ring finger ubiquitin ligase protein [Rutstroemia sp. NJR-2017a BVV2]|nr:ring finger ubiquitin ligase protein [Rutstroemia sp. NJR-2017a BVV2]